MKPSLIVVLTLSLISVVAVGCSPAILEPVQESVLVQQPLESQSSEVSDAEVSEILGEEFIAENDFIEIGEMI